MKLPVLSGVIGLSFLLTACPIPPPPPPYEPPLSFDYTGQWSGTVLDSVGGEGALGLTILTQSAPYGGALGGTWQGAIAGGGSGIVRGQLLHSETLSLSLISSATQGCLYNAELSHEEEVLTGTYLSKGCDPYVTGTLELRKQ
jgi:hypothetical protein